GRITRKGKRPNFIEKVLCSQASSAARTKPAGRSNLGRKTTMENVHTNTHEKQEKGKNETEKISVSSSPAVRYQIQKVRGKGNKWQVWDSVENKAVTQDGNEK